MPEGDNLARAAAVLGPVLAGQALTRVSTRGARRAELVGRRVDHVDAHGKHLFIHLDGGVALHVHLGMYGRIRRLSAADLAQDRAAAMLDRATLAVEWAGGAVACMNAPVARVVREVGEATAARAMPRLGPSTLAADPDVAGMVARARAPHQADRPVGELVLDQRVCAGIGNVYKSELLWLRRVHPLLRVRDLDDATLEGLFVEAIRLMRTNLGPWRRTTTADVSRGELPPRGLGRHFVYRRAGRPCPRCRTAVQMIRQGPQLRSTYFCPACQAR